MVGQHVLAHIKYLGGMGISHFIICHSNKSHRPRTSSCYKEQPGGTEYGLPSACMTTYA